MAVQSKPREAQLNLFQTPLPTPVLSKEVNEKTVKLLARMLREHAGRSCSAERKVEDE